MTMAVILNDYDKVHKKFAADKVQESHMRTSLIQQQFKNLNYIKAPSNWKMITFLQSQRNAGRWTGSHKLKNKMALEPPHSDCDPCTQTDEFQLARKDSFMVVETYRSKWLKIIS